MCFNGDVYRTSPVSEKMKSSKCCPQISKMPTLKYWRAAFLKEHRVLTCIYNVFNLRDTEVAICIMDVRAHKTNLTHPCLNAVHVPR
jgi:hypothetical protein